MNKMILKASFLKSRMLKFRNKILKASKNVYKLKLIRKGKTIEISYTSMILTNASEKCSQKLRKQEECMDPVV